MNTKQNIMNDFMTMRNTAELKALSNLSLEQPLSDKQFERLMQLKKEVLGI